MEGGGEVVGRVVGRARRSLWNGPGCVHSRQRRLRTRGGGVGGVIPSSQGEGEEGEEGGG